MPTRPRATAYIARKTQQRKQRRPQILLKKKEHERQANADDNRQRVLAAGQIHPVGQPDFSNHLAAKLPQQLPSAREIAGQKEREQQADRFDWLNRTEIDLGRAAPGSGTKQNQQDRQRERGGEREIAELNECRRTEIEERQACHQEESKGDAFGEPHKQQAVSQWIRPAQEDRKTDRGQQMCEREQQTVTLDPA